MKYAKLMGGLVVAAAAMTVSLPAWSAIPTENLIGGAAASTGTSGYWGQVHTPRIDMSKNVNATYSKGVFKASTASGASFTMVKPNSSTFGFKGQFTLDAKIDGKTGKLLSGGTFKFTSNSSVFGFGSTTSCTKYGCKTTANTGTVFAGSLTGFGWSESKGMLEFTTGNFSGWACAQGWCTTAERLKLTTGTNTLGLSKCIQNVTSWSAKGMSGSAVIPVPAAAWLFGSGLLGLIGFAKRRKS